MKVFILGEKIFQKITSHLGVLKDGRISEATEKLLLYAPQGI